MEAQSCRPPFCSDAASSSAHLLQGGWRLAHRCLSPRLLLTRMPLAVGARLLPLQQQLDKGALLWRPLAVVAVQAEADWRVC